MAQSLDKHSRDGSDPVILASIGPIFDQCIPIRECLMDPGMCIMALKAGLVF